jgi:diketogulonate reductase-like aldo/keto reductase
MEIPTKTLSSGFSLPVYGLGTWEMGGKREPDYSEDDKYVAAISDALDHGIRHIDTAEMYGAGHTEELVGKAIKGRDRSKLVITTKVSVGMSGGFDGVLKSAQDSLERLGTDYIDIYLLHHYPHGGDSVEEIMRAMDKLVTGGLVKEIGVCNMTIPRFQEIQKHTTNKLVCNQVNYSVQMREPEIYGLIQHAADNDHFITAWGALEKGLLEQGDILQKLARKYGKTPYQVALNWVIAQPNVITIPKTTSTEHLDENLGAIGWELEAEDLEELSKNFPNQNTVSSRVPLDYGDLRT